MEKAKIWHKHILSLLSVLVTLGIAEETYLYHRSYRSSEQNLNALREHLFVPPIEKDMILLELDLIDGITSSYWETDYCEFADEACHYWKIADYLEPTSLREEVDHYWLNISPSQYWILRIKSEIISDSTSIRSGSLALHYRTNLFALEPRLPSNRKLLTESGIDSVANEWRLYELIRHPELFD